MPFELKWTTWRNLWNLVAIDVHRLNKKFCYGHYSFFFRLSVIQLCHNLLHYGCNFEHTVQWGSVNTRCTNRQTLLQNSCMFRRPFLWRVWRGLFPLWLLLLLVSAECRHEGEPRSLPEFSVPFFLVALPSHSFLSITDHVTLNFNKNMSTAAVFLDIEKAIDTTRQPGLYELPKLQLPVNFIKLFSQYLSHRKVQSFGRRRTIHAREIDAGVPKVSVMALTLYGLYVNDNPQTPVAQLLLFADKTYIYSTERKEGYAKRPYCNGGVVWGLELKDQLRQVSGHILLWQTWTGQDSSYTQRMEHSFCKRGDSRITWKQQIDAIITKVFRTCIGIYPHLKSEPLSSNS